MPSTQSFKKAGTGNFSKFLPRWIKEWFKDIHTGIPGIVQEYDMETRKAIIQPALRVFVSDKKQYIDRAPLLEVPVLFPIAGNYIIHGVLKEDDPIWVLFSERGIAKFIETYEVSDTDGIGFFSENDAVALCLGFGKLEDFAVPENTEEGISIQSNEGDRFIQIKDDGIYIKHSEDKSITLKEDTVQIKLGSNVIKIDSSGNLTATVEGKTTIEASGDIDLTGQNIKLEGAINLKGDVVSEGTFHNNSVNIGSTHTHTHSHTHTVPGGISGTAIPSSTNPPN